MTVAGKGGRPKKPTQLKVLHGDRRDRIPTDEPVPDAEEIAKPDSLSEDAVEVWDRLAPDLIRKGVLTAWDVDMFAAFCNAVVVNRTAMAEVDEHGTKILTVARELASGDLVYALKPNPAWPIAKQSAELMTSIGGRFGLSPADRAGLSVGTGEQRDPNADLFTG